MMVPLCAQSVLMLGVVMDRFFAFQQHDRVDYLSLKAKVLELLRGGNIEEAAMLCDRTPHPVAAVLLAGIQAFDRHRVFHEDARNLATVVKQAMDDFTLHAQSAMEKRFGVLTAIGMSAPLFGMTGTVTGMITSFSALQTSGAGGAEVANGIAEALITTAAGLLIAMGAVLPYNYFIARSAAIGLAIEQAKTQFIDYIATESVRIQG